MPNNYFSVLYKHIIQVENENVGLKVCVCGGGGGGHKHTIAPPNQKGGGDMPPLPPPPLPTPVNVFVCYLTKKQFLTFRDWLYRRRTCSYELQYNRTRIKRRKMERTYKCSV